MDVVVVSAPLFALILIGYLAARFGLIPIEAIKGLNNYVLYFAITSMLFRMGSSASLEQAINPTVLTVWLLACWSVLGLAMAYGRTQGRTWLATSFGALAAALPNAGFMGIALVTAVLGTENLHIMVPIILADTAVLQGTAIAFSQLDAASNQGILAKLKVSFSGVLKNPMVWGTVTGVFWGATGWALPSILANLVDILADSATPVALFTVGAVLFREQRRVSERSSAKDFVAWIAFLKLLVLPLIMWGLGVLAMRMGLPLTSGELAVLVLVAALPSAANTTLLAEKFGADSGLVATALLTTSTIGFVTFNVVATLVS